VSAWWRWAVAIVPAFILYHLPIGLAVEARHLLAVFAGTIIALIARPVAMGASVVVGMTLLVLTGTLTPARALAGFSSPTVWMIFTAFLFARAVTATGFGPRVAYVLIRKIGHSTLTLGYAIAATNLVLAPFIPSDTGRGGGIVFPVARSLAFALGDAPRTSAYLILVGYLSTYTTSGMFLTSMAANPIMADMARQIAHVDITFLTWATAAIVPGLITLAIGPLMILRATAPESIDIEAARGMAADALAKLGRLSSREIRLVVILLTVMGGWVSSPWHGIHNAFVALAGLSAFVLSNVVTWEEMLGEARAWDALLWFGPILMMTDELAKAGVFNVLSQSVVSATGGMPWPVIGIALAAGYMYIHYAFASMTAQATALYAGFLGAGVAAGCPPMMLAIVLAAFSSLNAGITHYGTGSATVFFGAGLVTQGQWWRIGFSLSILNLIVWLGIGPLWWKLIGIWP
jgi:divalent anion:Na+ symporter, DASS family